MKTSVLQETDPINYTIVLVSSHIQCFNLTYSEVALVLVSLGTQVWPQVILDLDFLPDHLSVSYDYDWNK